MDNFIWGLLLGLIFYFSLTVISTRLALLPLRIRVWSIKDDKLRNEESVKDAIKKQRQLEEKMQEIYKGMV